MSVDLPEVHARALASARRSVAGVGDGPMDRRVRLRGLDRPRAGEPRRDRQLLGRRADRRQDDRRGRHRARRRRAGRRPAGDLRRVGDAPPTHAFRAPGAMEAPCAVSYGPVPGRGVLRAPLPRRAGARVGRRPSTGQDTDPRSRAGRGACSRCSSRSSTGCLASGMFGTVVEVPDDADRQTQLLAVLGRQG